METNLETTSFILDTEIVAIGSDGTLKSFQDLSNRPRKNVQLQDIQLSVCVFAFDLMYLNGDVSALNFASFDVDVLKILLGRTFRDRRDILRSCLPPFCSTNRMIARFDHVESCSSEQGRAAMETFWEKAIASRCEGLMVKVSWTDSDISINVLITLYLQLLDSAPMIEGSPEKATKSRKKQLPATYEPDKRTNAWLKLKKDYVTGVGDTLDLIPIGAWYGNGRKAQWWSPILLGLWQPELGRVVAVCKCMSGS